MRLIAPHKVGLMCGVQGRDMKVFHSCALRARIPLLIGLAAFTSTAAAGTYVLNDLGAQTASSSFASGINSLGQVVGGISNSGGPTQLFVYTQGRTVIQTVPGLDAAFSVEPSGINDVGQVTGFGCCLQDSPSSFVYNFNTHTVAAIPVGPQSSAGPINDRGEVTGEESEGLQGPFAYLYDSRTGTVSGLGSLAPGLFDATSSGNGINPAGAVTGGAQIESGAQHAFLYIGGEMRDLGTLGGQNSAGNAINRADQITGWSDTASGDMHAFKYASGTMKDLGTLGGAFSQGNSINAAGDIVGESSEAGDATDHAFIYRHHRMNDLNRLIDSHSPLAKFVTLSEGVGINDRGEIAANGTDSRTGESHAYLLTRKNQGHAGHEDEQDQQDQQDQQVDEQ